MLYLLIVNMIFKPWEKEGVGLQRGETKMVYTLYYGNSTHQPRQIFSRASSQEQLK